MTREEDELSTVLNPRLVPRTRRTPAFRIAVTRGPDCGREVTIDGNQPSRVLIGKSPACALCLSDAQVSRRHASLDVLEDELSIVDLESTNGTFVNGIRFSGAFLHGGEVVTVGETALQIDRVDDRVVETPAAATAFGKTLGASREMRRLYPLCERLAASTIPVLIEGETGTGKEVLAESLHEAGPRAGEPFVVFDCTEPPPTLLESELFGHERGAFTGAAATRKGVFERAHGGTLFIDEIGELDASLQPKLLRAVERFEIRRVGGADRIPVDVRVIVATRRDLDREVQEGRFRDDLFFRLAVARIELPPLRARRSDVALLSRHFWSALGGEGVIPYDFLQRLESYAWPGNVRELRNAISRRIALGDLPASTTEADADGEAAPRATVGDVLESILAMDLAYSRARTRLLREFETRYVERVLSKHGGNVTHAARASGIARRYFNVIRARHPKP